MRLSIYEDDHKECSKYKVFLDGVEVKYAIEADEEMCYVDRYKNNSYSEVERLYGKVELRAI